MKNLTLLLSMLVTSMTAFTQDYSNLGSIPLDDSMQCKKAESKVLECSDYLLSKPCVEDLNSLKVCQFLLKWMGQTPDYQFGFDDNLYKSIKSDMMLMGRYLACQSKIAINEKPKSFDKDFQFKYIKMFLEYCEDSKNEVKISARIKKLIEAKNNGKLMDEI
jgi:hypothetical protein